MIAVAIYARYSSDQQRDASIEDQIRLCRERAAKEGWKIFKNYSDRGISGASLMRQGIQALLQDAAAGKFGIILAEALDRISRDQEDVAAVYKRMRFAGVKIVTLSEGEITSLHVGLKGTMNALFLQDLADKTRRGLRGRVEAGKSGGGNSFGYDVVRRVSADGTPVRGERVINEREASIIRRIFNAYASGVSPKAIARTLNREGIVGPAGKDWGASTIHGHRERGTGILNNELYIGRIVWNRLRYIKDPDTGKRVSRLNPSAARIVKEAPALRIIDDALWERVKTRQSALYSHRKARQADGFWDRRRPRYLFSGLLKCGSCGGAFVKVSVNHFGCAASRNKGTCDNRLTIRRDRLESAVLDGLQNRLMDPALCEVFAEEYARHMNRLRMDHNASLAAHRAELTKTTREVDRLIQAIIDGVPGAQVKDRIAALEARKKELEEILRQAPDQQVLIHPNMGRYYRNHVVGLREALSDGERNAEAADIIRGLVERIVLTPSQEGGRRTLSIDLFGELAGILALAADSKKPAPASQGGLEQIKLVAGAGFEPVTFRL